MKQMLSDLTKISKNSEFEDLFKVHDIHQDLKSLEFQLSELTRSMKTTLNSQMHEKFYLSNLSNADEVEVRSTISSIQNRKNVFQSRILSWKPDDILAYFVLYLEEGANLNLTNFVKECFQKSFWTINGSALLRLSLEEWNEIFFVYPEGSSITEQDRILPNVEKRIQMAHFANNQCNVLKS